MESNCGSTDGGIDSPILPNSNTSTIEIRPGSRDQIFCGGAQQVPPKRAVQRCAIAELLRLRGPLEGHPLAVSEFLHEIGLPGDIAEFYSD